MLKYAKCFIVIREFCRFCPPFEKQFTDDMWCLKLYSVSLKITFCSVCLLALYCFFSGVSAHVGVALFCGVGNESPSDTDIVSFLRYLASTINWEKLSQSRDKKEIEVTVLSMKQ